MSSEQIKNLWFSGVFKRYRKNAKPKIRNEETPEEMT